MALGLPQDGAGEVQAVFAGTQGQGGFVPVFGGQGGQEVATSGVFKLRPEASVVVNNKTQPSSSRSPRPEDN